MVRALLGGLAIAFLLLGQQQDGDKNLAAIEGHAVNAASGEPIHKAVVRLSVRGANRVIAIVGSTDADGARSICLPASAHRPLLGQ